MASDTNEDEIRRRAEDLAQHQLHKLESQQTELETQNSRLRRAHERLEDSRRRYELLFDFAAVALFVFDADGAVVDANDAAANLLKTERKSLERAPFVSFVAMEYHAPFFAHLRRVFETAQRQSTEVQLITRHGAQIWARIESRDQLGLQDEPQCLTAVLDISDRKQLEDDLILAREDALSANQAKTAFLADVSHEIRTPMNGILAMSELAAESGLTGPPQRYVSAIHSAARSLLSILDDVRDVTRIEAGRRALDRRPFQVRRLLTTLHAMLHPSAEQKHLDFDVEAPDLLSDVLVGDRNRIRQILVNLLSNALNFTQSGSVTLRVREDEISDFLRELTFEVSDTGPGMNPVEQDRVSETLQTERDEDETRYEGTGLGLAISRQLAKLMGGQLYFESEPGSGSRFFFSVPLEIPNEEEVTAPAVPLQSASAPDKTARLLVAEDNAINLLVIRTILEKAGYSVVAVGSGQDAIDALEQERFELVLMDISMPGMDGITATQEIRSRSGDEWFHADVPIIAISAHSMKGDREKFLEAGMNDYISKPFVRDTVLSVVKRNIGSSD